jgi:hypothetical protein
VKLRGDGARGKVGASARYYGHRPNAEGQKEWRPAFSETHGGLSKEEVKGLVGHAEGSHAYRMVLSPGKEMDEGELRTWTRDVMASGWERGWFGGQAAHEPSHYEEAYYGALGREYGEDFARWERFRDWSDRIGEEGPERWVAWAHTDHTDNPHVHVIAFTDRRLERGDFAAVREEGDAWAERVVESRRELEQDPLQAERGGLEELVSARGREHEPEVGHGY